MGQEIADILISAGAKVAGFVDDDPDLWGSSVLGLPVLGDLKRLDHRSGPVAMGIGSPAARRKAWTELREQGVVDSPPLVHPTAYVGLGCRLGVGSVVGAGATLTADVDLGRFVIVNAGATVSHNCRLADFATVAPGVHLAGNTTVEEGAEIGIGACVIQQLTIGSWSVVGAGAVVIHDVPPNTTVAGCPARVIAVRHPGRQE